MITYLRDFLGHVDFHQDRTIKYTPSRLGTVDINLQSLASN